MCTVPAAAAGKCSAAALKAVLVGSGIKAAFCTDAHLILHTNGAPTWIPNLDDVPNPPGSQFSNGTACVTRSASQTPSYAVWRIPLTWTLLPTAASTNNMNNFPDGAADSNMGYMAGALGSYGLPTRGAVGVSVSGQEMFPLYNNRAELTPLCRSCDDALVPVEG
ncbi:hypothetical protein TSOC_012719 [Tetrabaena socialis]|uniref:Uncharacterized protein n=1 Tax=Tetrabaena socialis TaxID=47790 RepID=A0A2J7ZMA8_9CHLO|nr:hypothetical protein TSOC_012719 [Tetrabaena socialis]|eukprot:PNH01401.1 hypothetical protein TSOC_012719 [Tetrabaena socialis]